LPTIETSRQILPDAANAKKFIFAGKSRFTIRSVATGERYTYKVTRHKDYSEEKNFRLLYVKLLVGRDNTNDYKYICFVKNDVVFLGKSSRMTNTSKPYLAIKWLLEQLNKGALPASVEVWHEGRCGRCGRTLTVPESIASGFGPECANFVF
jgi:hypothetical protein